MGITIEDGAGSGKQAKVNDDLQLLTRAIIESGFEFTSEDKGLSFAWASGTYDPDAGDTILLVKNTSTTRTLHINQIWISTDTDTRVVVHLPSADVTVAGTTVTGTNLNTTSGNVADASAARDETGNTQGVFVWTGEVMAATNPTVIELDGALILGTNKSIGVDFVAATTAGDVTIFGHYE